MKKFLLIVSAPFLVWGLERFCHQKTQGFSMMRVSSDLSFHPEWEISLGEDEKKEIQTLLSQPFTYFGKGAQAFSFLSQDGRYVLKLFQHYRMRPPLWTYLPLPHLLKQLAAQKIARRETFLHHDFTSYKIAFEELRQETGMVYLHLNKTESLQQNVTLIDNLGIAHTINLDRMEFLIQKRGELVYPSLLKALQNGDREGAQKLIDGLIALQIKRCKQGIFDKDPDFSTNFGVCEGVPFQIDVGQFSKSLSHTDPSIYKDDLIRATDRFYHWLKEHDEPLGEYLFDQVRSLGAKHEIDHLMSQGKFEESKEALTNAIHKIKRPQKVPKFYKKELTQIVEPFKAWIDETHPGLSAHLQKEIAKLMEDDE